MSGIGSYLLVGIGLITLVIGITVMVLGLARLPPGHRPSGFVGLFWSVDDLASRLLPGPTALRGVVMIFLGVVILGFGLLQT